MQTKEEIKQYKKEYYLKNKQAILEHKRTYRNENKEKVAKQRRQYCLKTKEQKREYDKKYREQNKAKEIARRIKIRITPLERFFKYVDITDETDCWLWKGQIPKERRYGYFTINSKALRAHRYIYTQIFGEIKKGYEVCHTCDNPSCVNPWHLFLGTHEDNMKDMVNKNRSRKGEKSAKAKLTQEEVLKIKHDERKASFLSTEYKVSKSTIYDIKKGKTWCHLEEPA